MMKKQFWSTIIMTPFLILSFFNLLARKSQANTEIDISCNTESVTPTIVGTASTGYRSQSAQILRFLPQYFPPEVAVQNCQTTATKLQALYRQAELNYLASDALNEKPVVCIVESRGLGCDSYNSKVLFTVERQVEPSEVLYNMLGDGFKQGEFAIQRTVGRIYTDIRPAWWPFK